MKDHLVSEVITATKINRNPIKSLIVILSLYKTTENNIANTASRLIIIEACVGFVCFCPMVCNKRAIAVANTYKYNNPIIEPVSKDLGISSKSKVAIQEKIAVYPN